MYKDTEGGREDQRGVIWKITKMQPKVVQKLTGLIAGQNFEGNNEENYA